MSTSFDVPPILAANNSPCGGLAYAEATPYISLSHGRSPKAPYLSDICLCEFCHRVIYSFRLICAALANFILHIVRVRPQEQMLRIAARRVVAGMKDIKAVRNRTVGENPRLPVGIFLPASVGCEAVICPILIMASAHPRPARIGTARLIDFIPEVFDVRVFNRKAGGASALIVLSAHALRPSRAGTLWFGAGLVRRCLGAYLDFSHIEVPSRFGQKRRPVSSGRRFAFMPHLVASAQGAAHG